MFSVGFVGLVVAIACGVVLGYAVLVALMLNKTVMVWFTKKYTDMSKEMFKELEKDFDL